ncbi:SIMPL domain-containing protein [Candidatus Pacearchaeota archaeon]|nr:SIMPL domain-containing protein [Candidatus Pacearchaeota archaeon]
MPKKGLKKTLIISVTLIIIAIIILIAVKNPLATNTINVEGSATINVIPNLVTIYFNIETSGDTTAEASEANTEIVEELKNSLISLGIEKENLITQNYNVYQDYDWINNIRIEKGYKTTHSIKIEICTGETEKIGEIIDAGTQVGATINYINFELTSDLQNQYKAEAMHLAAEDARMKAEAIAEGLDKKVGRLVSVSTSNFDYSPWGLYESTGLAMTENAIEAKVATTNIQPGEQEIYGQITAVFKLR